MEFTRQDLGLAFAEGLLTDEEVRDWLADFSGASLRASIEAQPQA